MIDEYYVLRGLMLDSEHENIDNAIARAKGIIEKYGNNHVELKIGNRNSQEDNDILLIYYRGGEFIRKDNKS